jgi:hypothetical protein
MNVDIGVQVLLGWSLDIIVIDYEFERLYYLSSKVKVKFSLVLNLAPRPADDGRVEV